jgi:hypothetical protein
MPHELISPRLTFEDAVVVHALRAQGVIFSELTRIFGANPARFHEILCGKLFPGSWDAAVQRLAAGDGLHAEVARLIQATGRDRVLSAVMVANPAKKQFMRERKRLLRSSPIPFRTLRAV